MIDLNIKHYFSGREYAKEMTLPAAYYAETHVHKFDHLSILASGTVTVTLDGVAQTHVGPTCLTIRAGQVHRIEALTDSVWFCVHAHEGNDPDAVDRILVKEA
ncbi:AraC family ligand binding domain-containing protein [Massilia antarctica]|uniref:AraC family ligand binding domain-containing protein n=1 Tax=Massilia antarctica TaxID=2765360 RepID=UPI0035EE7342